MKNLFDQIKQYRNHLINEEKSAATIEKYDVMKKDMRAEKQKEYEKRMYHNTEILLKRYRDVVWSMEVSAIQARMNFEFEMGCGLDEFLQMSYAAGMDFSGTNIQEQIRTLERSKKMLNIIDTSAEILKKREHDETLYWVIYYTYLSKKTMQFAKIDEFVLNIELMYDIIQIENL